MGERESRWWEMEWERKNLRERRMGVHVCERERVWNGRGGRKSSSRESRGWKRE